MTEDQRIVPVEKATFSDDSFRIADPAGVVVSATLPDWCELRWFGALARVCGSDLRWAAVRNRWPDLSAELQRAVLRDIRDALITIVDGSLYRRRLEEAVEDVIRKPKSSWPPHFHAWMAERLAEYEIQSILDDSPVVPIQEYLEDDGDVLGDPGGLAGNTDPDRSIVTELATSLRNPHNARIFGTRVAAAFAHVIDRSGLDGAIDRLRDMRYFLTPQRLMGEMLAIGERTGRVFDEGHKKSVAEINSLKESVRERLITSPYIEFPQQGMPPGATEQPSHVQPLLQAADLAGGYARQLYVEYGLRAVCEEFKGVIHNGKMIRTWSQIERTDGSLRPRR